MQITCPLCHQVSEVPFAVEDGQHVRCPYCNAKFAYGRMGSTILREGCGPIESNGADDTRKRLARRENTILQWWIIISVALIVFLGVKFFYLDRTIRIGNSECVAKIERTTSGSRIVTIDIPGCERSSGLGDACFNGFRITIECSTKVLSVKVGKEDLYGTVHYFDFKSDDFDMSRFDISTEDDWKKFCMYTMLAIRRNTSKELIDFVKQYR